MAGKDSRLMDHILNDLLKRTEENGKLLYDLGKQFEGLSAQVEHIVKILEGDGEEGLISKVNTLTEWQVQINERNRIKEKEKQKKERLTWRIIALIFSSSLLTNFIIYLAQRFTEWLHIAMKS